MLVGYPHGLAPPAGSAMAEVQDTFPRLSRRLAEDCESGYARQGTVSLFRETFGEASISYVG